MGVRIWLGWLSVVLWVSSASMVQAGNNIWTSLRPEGGIVTALAIDSSTPTTLYAGTQYDGVYKSTDGGSTWRAVNTGLTNPYVYALVIDPTTPTTLYTGIQDGGVFKSTDGGSTWRAVNTGLPYFYSYDFDTYNYYPGYALAIDPAHPAPSMPGLHMACSKALMGGGAGMRSIPVCPTLMSTPWPLIL